MRKSELPEFVLAIIARLNKAGFKAFIVGGSVRDILLGKTPHDWDIATSALPDNIQALFEKTIATGVKHGTVTVIFGGGKAEITTFRTEGAYSDSRRPDSVSFVSDLKQDLARRDFTINAMAMTASGDIVDYFGGAANLESGLIRCVGEAKARFEEDALRMLRALRFKAVLGFEIEPTTLRAIKDCAHLAGLLSAERVREELRKILLSKSPETLESVIEFGLLNSFLKPLSINLDRISGLCFDENVRLCALCSILKKNGLILLPKLFLEQLRFSGNTVSLICSALSVLDSPPPRSAPEIKRLLRDYGKDAVSCAAAASSDGNFSMLLERVLSSAECWSLKQLKVNGSDMEALGYKGSGVKVALSYLLDHVIDRPMDNERNILLNLSEFQLNNHLT